MGELAAVFGVDYLHLIKKNNSADLQSVRRGRLTGIKKVAS